MAEQKYKVVELSSLKMEDGARELLSSPEMEPYMRYAEALMIGEDLKPSIREIAALPLERRYVWRVASALKWGFADFDDASVTVDRNTLSQEDGDRLMELLKFRPIQFCMFLKALIGAEAMELAVMQAVDVAKQK